MRTIDYVLLAVQNPTKSAALYEKLLGVAPVERSETFCMFVLPNGLKLGLWIARDVQPAPNAPGGVEIAFTEASRDAVLATYEAWKKLGMEVLQEPTDMDFGFTFVVRDADGHRLRPFVPAERPR